MKIDRSVWTLLIAAIVTTQPYFVSGARAEDSAMVGKITRVTLYRGQALVSRTIEVTGTKGSHELVVSDLPLTILDGSLYADSTGDVEVRAVRFRQRAVGEEPREEVRLLDEELASVQKALRLNAKQTELAKQKLAYLDQLQSFVAPTAGTELSQGVLNADTLKQLTEYSFEQRAAIAEREVDLAKEQEDLTQQWNLLNRQRSELTKNAQRTINEAVLFIEKLDGADQSIELNYLVSNCGWTPTYSIKSLNDRSKSQIEYNALIEQVTGENWENVELTLSTASPWLSASGPSLAPFSVTLESRGQAASSQSGPMQVEQTQSYRLDWNDSNAAVHLYKDNRAKQMVANQALGNSVDFMAKTDGNWSVNVLACQIQGLELANPMEVLSTVQVDSGSVDAPSITYQLSNQVSLASRTDQQMVRIFNGELPSNFYHVATPLLSSYVYREAEITNSSEFDFLGGTVSVYLDNRFVGRAEIPTVAQGEAFVLGFGSDAQLRVRRELVEKKDGIRGGNKELKMVYRLSVENYKDKDVALRLMDRLPYSDKASEVRILLGDLNFELSKDPTYLRRERPKNILRWDLDVPAGASGEKSLAVEYDFTVDHDRSFVIADAANERAAEEFQKLERARQKK